MLQESPQPRGQCIQPLLECRGLGPGKGVLESQFDWGPDQ